jgi:HD-like signal output (HDOD) protein
MMSADKKVLTLQEKIEAIVSAVDDLPTLPEVVTDILNNLDNDAIDFTILAKKVALDPALSAKTLRLANSPFYATQSKVKTIQQAISLLGVKIVRRIVTTAALTNSFPEPLCQGFDFKAFWRLSMATAICSKVIARHLRLNQDIAFIAGMMHNIGRLVLATRFSTDYEAVLAYRKAQDCALIFAERHVMGFDHTVAGRALADHWQFSHVLKDAISEHIQPNPTSGSHLAQIVHVANAVAHALDLAGVEDDLVPALSESAWDALGTSRADWLQIFREVELEFGEIQMAI